MAGSQASTRLSTYALDYIHYLTTKMEISQITAREVSPAIRLDMKLENRGVGQEIRLCYGHIMASTSFIAPVEGTPVSKVILQA